MDTAITDIAEVVEVNEGFQAARKRKRRRITSSSSSVAEVSKETQKGLYQHRNREAEPNPGSQMYYSIFVK